MATETADRPKTFVAPDLAEHFVQFSRNGRWGTCVHCPRDTSGHVYPEFCPNTDRGDHHLDIDGLVEKHKRYVARVEKGEIKHRR